MSLCKGESNHVSKGIITAYPCKNKAWEGGFCKVHHPDQWKANESKRWERWEKRWALDRIAKAQTVAGSDYSEARKEAGLLTYDEARALGAKI